MKDRILKIIDFYKLNGAAFAVKVGIKDSQLSHIKSGRNEPSLDIVTKILENCPEISSEWLLFGSGDMVKNVVEKTITQPIKPQKEPIQLSIDGLFENNLINGTNQRTEIEIKPSLGNQNSVATQTTSVDTNDSKKNSQSSGVLTSSESKTISDPQKSTISNTSVKSETNHSSSQPSTTNGGSTSHPQEKAENNTSKQSSIVNSDIQDNREIGISLTKQELLDLLTTVHRPKIAESSEKMENSTIIEKTQAIQPPRIKKIIVYYSDKSYEEFMPAQ